MVIKLGTSSAAMLGSIFHARKLRFGDFGVKTLSQLLLQHLLFAGKVPLGRIRR
jgi:hypothetical protein